MAVVNDSIKVVSWNINNFNSRLLGNKLETNEVKSFLNQYDIVCLVETHAKKGDELTLPGFKKPFRIDRPITNKKAYGGIAVFVKEKLWKSSNICPIKTKNENALWVKISGKSKGCNDIYLGTVYLSPENKKNKDKLKDCISILREDIELFSKRGSIFLFGDFNARTNIANDFMLGPDLLYDDEDEDVIQYSDLNLDVPYQQLDRVDTEKLPENRSRNSQDQAPTSKRGKELISLCKDFELSILNGRKLGDIFGKITCFRSNGCSVVDYAICSSDLLDIIPSFSVGLHRPWLSDHCPIQSVLPISGTRATISDKKFKFSKLPPKFYWDDNSKERFEDVLRTDEVTTQLNTVKASLTKTGKYTYPVTQLKIILVNVAKKANVQQKTMISHSAKNSENKIWYDKECQVMKTSLAEAASALQKDPSNQQKRINVNNKRKEYKKIIRNKKLSHENKCLQGLAQAYPDKKKFWKLLGKIRENGNKDCLSAISPCKIISHFQDLFKSKRPVEEVIKSNETGCLDYAMSEAEIEVVLSKAKKNVAGGLDSIDHFMIYALNKNQPNFLPALFTSIINSGEFPTEWSTAILVPIHKKGSKLEIANYRGISLLSTLGKLFVSILNNRIVKWAEENKVLSQGQIGFLKGNRTSDALIIVHNIISKYCVKQGKKVYSCLVDFEKAFDNVPRDLMLKKLDKIGINGNMLNIINSMYRNDKACIRVNQKISPAIPVSKGVRQGCVLSPTLFNIFLSDFEVKLDNEMAHPVENHNNNKLPCIIWADDVLLISETKDGLQYQISSLVNFCNENKMSINVNKTKCICFNKSGRLIRNFFTANGVIIEDVKDVRYLGFVICSNGNVQKGLLDLRDRARKAYYKLKQAMGIGFYNNVSLTMKLFDILIKPILLYASDFWGMNKLNTLEKNPCENLNIVMCKQILGLSSNVSNIASLLELGRCPISLDAKKNALNNWLRLTGVKTGNFLVINSVQNSISEELKWAEDVKKCLQDNGLKLVWDFPSMFKQKSATVERFHKYLGQKFYDQASIYMKSSLKYKLFWELKKNHSGQPSSYLLTIKNLKHRKALTKLRMANTNLEIQTGRFKNIEYKNRTCKICMNEVETEEHFLLKCKAFDNLRETMLQQITCCEKEFSKIKKEERCIYLLKSPDSICHILSKFIWEATERRSQILKTLASN